MRYVVQKEEEIEALEFLLKTSSDNTIRKRSQCHLLSHHKRTIIDLSGVFGVSFYQNSIGVYKQVLVYGLIDCRMALNSRLTYLYLSIDNW